MGMRIFLTIFLLFFFANCKDASLHFPLNIDPPKKASDFRLTDKNGVPFELYKDTKGKSIIILFFGYAHCPDICISVLEKLSKVLERLSEKEKMRISMIFISIDPSRDNAASLREYASRFNPNIYILSGDTKTITDIKNNYKIFAEKNSRFHLNSGESEIIHSTNLIWIDKNYKMIRSLPHQFDQNDLLEEIQFAIQSQ